MMASGQHLLDMINAVLDMSRIEADELELHPVEIELLDLVRVCLDVVRPAADAKGLGLVLAPAARLRLFADPTRLRQVLINLLGNAVKFTPAGGVEVRLMQANDEASIRLEVADTGPGIRDRHVDKLFQTFERLNAEAVSGIEGAGLGLAIAARLVHAMGGEIGYTGNPGGGSVFWLELPGSCVVTAAIDGIAPPVLPAKPRMVVLVADDEALNRSIATGFLTMGGHEVVCVANGAEAVEAAANQDFDLILMDVRMPGMNGLEATRRIRMLPAPRGDVRIVAVTAQAFAQQIEICRRAGMNGHVSKPFKQAVLLAAVENVAEAPDGTSFTVVPSASASAGSELPVFDRTAFEDMTDSLSPADLGQHLRTLSARGEALSRGLREPDMLARLGELAEAAHLFAGGAGTLGFMSVAAAARRFEAAADANEGATLTLADELVAEIDLSMTALRREFGFPDETLSEANWGLTRAGGE
jgi:CheY-like chemotaxis protein/HPt (histidine-containing phosphotransfer) domain-containing protein